MDTKPSFSAILGSWIALGIIACMWIAGIVGAFGLAVLAVKWVLSLIAGI